MNLTVLWTWILSLYLIFHPLINTKCFRNIVLILREKNTINAFPFLFIDNVYCKWMFSLNHTYHLYSEITFVTNLHLILEVQHQLVTKSLIYENLGRMMMYITYLKFHSDLIEFEHLSTISLILIIPYNMSFT